MILALGAMVLLSLVIINVNKNAMYTEDAMYDSSFGILATSLATSVIEDASRKHYDDKTDTIYIDKLIELTPVNKLGIDAGETANDPTTFDDFDDYNNYEKIDDSMPSAIFRITAKVHYVDPVTPDVALTSTGWHKRIDVVVSSKFMRDTIKHSAVYSYWNFY
jgi:hypothetical protein